MKPQTVTHSTNGGVSAPAAFLTSPNPKQVRILTEADRQEVLAFLKIEPVQTVMMTSFIQDNGMENTANRGFFYGFRNLRGTLEGVALIGHTTLIEARSANSLKAFAFAARKSATPIHFMMSDGSAIESFWRHYNDRADSAPRLVCSEVLFETKLPFFAPACRWNVRLAETVELEPIAAAHDEVARTESGSSPLARDREGFLKRCLKRIEQKRTFVVFENGKLVFKADIAAETSDVIYLEGIYVAADTRGQGIGAACLSEVSRRLMKRVKSVCLLSNIEYKRAHRSFIKAGFQRKSHCRTIFV